MSIGNLKDTGNQGNNLPFQWKVLQGLQEIANQTAQPLTCVEDSVTICVSAINNNLGIYGYNGGVPTPISVNASGQLITQGSYAEDTSHTSGSPGVFVMGVRNDGNTPMTSANSDYSPFAVNINGAVAIQDGGNSITVDGGTGLLRTTGMIRPAGGAATNLNLTVPTFYSVSVANVGSNDGTVLGATIKPGEVLNFSADAINNYFNSFAYNAAGTEFIIIYVS